MELEQVKLLETIFTNYAESFFGSDQFVNSNLHLKLCHSYKVRSLSRDIAKSAGLDDENICLAEAIGMLHDIGRFPQFAKYRTYKDIESIDHSILGADEIIAKQLLEKANINKTEAEIIDIAVRNHGKKEISAKITGPALLHTKIIRDADKIDIFRVVIMGYKLYNSNPDKFLYEIEYPLTSQYSRKVYQAVANAEKVDYKIVKTMNDMRLLQLAWVFDMNFAYSLQALVDRGYIDDLFHFLPDDPAIRSLKRDIFSYISKKNQSA